jgi:4'-phosphopantetheinyl transferase
MQPGEIHAWYRMTDPIDYVRYRLALSRDELDHCDRFRFARDRCDYANAHALLRMTLSRYSSTPAHEWRFSVGAHGKPFLSPTSHDEGRVEALTFNLSHTHGLVACAVARGIAVGIDVERVDRVSDAMALATAFFSPAEVAGLHECVNEHDRVRRFIELWTLKESFIKATGKGLTQPLNSFTFDLREPGTVGFIPPDALASGWNFAQYDVAPATVMALSICAKRPPRIVVRRADASETASVAPIRFGRTELPMVNN